MSSQSNASSLSCFLERFASGLLLPLLSDDRFVLVVVVVADADDDDDDDDESLLFLFVFDFDADWLLPCLILGGDASSSPS